MGSTTLLEGSEKKGGTNTDFCQINILPAPLRGTAYIYTTTAQARVGTSQSSLKQLDFNPKAGRKENLDQLLPPIPSHVREIYSSCRNRLRCQFVLPSQRFSLPHRHTWADPEPFDRSGPILSTHTHTHTGAWHGSIEAAPSRKGLISFSQPSLHSSFRCPASFQQANRDRSHTPRSRGGCPGGGFLSPRQAPAASGALIPLPLAQRPPDTEQTPEGRAGPAPGTHAEDVSRLLGVLQSIMDDATKRSPHPKPLSQRRAHPDTAGLPPHTSPHHKTPPVPNRRDKQPRRTGRALTPSQPGAGRDTGAAPGPLRPSSPAVSRSRPGMILAAPTAIGPLPFPAIPPTAARPGPAAPAGRTPPRPSPKGRSPKVRRCLKLFSEGMAAAARPGPGSARRRRRQRTPPSAGARPPRRHGRSAVS